MKITVAGEKKEVADGMTVAELIVREQVRRNRVVSSQK